MIRLKRYIEKRAIELAEYIVKNKCTVRSAAKKFNVSKSTVHKDVAVRMYDIDKSLLEKVRKVLDDNLETRHIRGGNATKEKYEKIKKQKV